MRKQTKLVAVLSTAALLALGASMSSFAATGWQEENGTWVYYDKNGDKETEKWEKSGDNWFYLNEDGEMATDVIVEYNDNYYYVDENGSMVANKWVSVENEDYDGDSEEPTNHWYYFGSNGKAYKSSTNGSTISFKSINGKKYIFDDEGKMQYGWINSEGETDTSDEAWQTAIYYCGDENDGAQAVGWKYLDIVDTNYDDTDKKLTSSKNVFDDENQTRYFWFKSNGKKQGEDDSVTIGGKKYSFDEFGRMNAEWVTADATPSTATASQWRYHGTPEDGAKVTKGWFKVVPDEILNSDDYDDDSDAWYYADSNGDLIAGEIKTISGKKYIFDNKGRMKSGLRLVQLAENSTRFIEDVKGMDPEGHEVDTEEDFRDNINGWLDQGYSVYYFGSGDDGSMKTGKQNVSLDGDSFSFLFNKSGSSKGASKNGEDTKKFYQAGMLLKADKDDKFAVVKEQETTKGVRYTLLTTDDFLNEDYVSSVDVPTADEKKMSEKWVVNNSAAANDADGTIKYYLINTSGTKQNDKKKAKDGNDRLYVQDDYAIDYIYTEK